MSTTAGVIVAIQGVIAACALAYALGYSRGRGKRQRRNTLGRFISNS